MLLVFSRSKTEKLYSQTFSLEYPYQMVFTIQSTQLKLRTKADFISRLSGYGAIRRVGHSLQLLGGAT